jgi:hypothetical protein
MAEPKQGAMPQTMQPGQAPMRGRPVMRPAGPMRRMIPYNPRNYLRPDMRRAKVIDLNKMMETWGKTNAKFKEGDIFISKKILQNLAKADNLAGVLGQKKFQENLKVIDDILSEGKGNITYKFKESEGYLGEDVLAQNYIHHYANNVWEYYCEKNKNIKK